MDNGDKYLDEAYKAYEEMHNKGSCGGINAGCPFCDNDYWQRKEDEEEDKCAYECDDCQYYDCDDCPL